MTGGFRVALILKLLLGMALTGERVGEDFLDSVLEVGNAPAAAGNAADTADTWGGGLSLQKAESAEAIRPTIQPTIQPELQKP